MNTVDYPPYQHLGHKIEGARNLVGVSQEELADRLGFTKLEVIKLEQTENIDDATLNEVAKALGVSVEGLKKFNDESAFYYTNNFFENSNAKIEGSMNGNVQNVNHFTVEQAVKLFEESLKMDFKKFKE